MTQVAAIVSLVVALEGGSLRLDKGLADGLQPGDRGRVFYTLQVDSRPFRIEVGEAEIIEADDLESRAKALGSIVVRKGHQVEFPFEAERWTPTGLLETANQRLSSGNLLAALAYFKKLDEVVEGDPLVNRRILEIESQLEQESGDSSRLGYYRMAARASLQEGDLASVRSYVDKILKLQPDDPIGLGLLSSAKKLRREQTMLAVRAGSYEIGVDLGEARFFNQQPRFSIDLAAYWIDRLPGQQDDDLLRGLSYSEAESHCRGQGKRLPTEFEWEVAAQLPGFHYSQGVSEWTSSWYQAYPGNHKNEPEYGDIFRVVRGFDAEGEFDPKVRFFLEPEARAHDMGVRCVIDGPVE